MGCRIGITTDLETRKRHWKSVYKGFRDWRVVAGPFKTREEAQAEEDRLAALHGCEAHGGGDDPDIDAPWYVYRFTHSGEK
jgi:hypothetical protein